MRKWIQPVFCLLEKEEAEAAERERIRQEKLQGPQ